jgi:AraC family transcriptional regulator of adaptative response / DNA-3-methyladenine glycosylase II
VILEFESCYRALKSRDSRFDGWFYAAVTSTGIYCRPSCPARTPKSENVRFYPTSAAAQQAGFRACKRCRPDAAPGSPEWDTRSDLVARAMRLISDGLVDRSGVGGLAAALGYSARQLERLLVAEVGAGPLALARAQRAQTARVLIESSQLAIADIAFAAGFSSVRQFNDSVRAVFACSPTALRRTLQRKDGRAASRTAIALRLPFRHPFSLERAFDSLAATAVPGVEEVREGCYRRTLRLSHGYGIAELRSTAGTRATSTGHVACLLTLSDMRDLQSAVARCRRLLDLDADPEAVDAALSAHPELAPLVFKAPGARVVRSVDNAELAIRVVAAQQIGSVAARSLIGHLVANHGEPVDDPAGGLSRLFPHPAALTAVGGSTFTGPASRRATIEALCGELASRRLDLGPGCDRHQARSMLRAIKGIGPWTAEVVAMRALGDPDAFPSSDLGLRRAAAQLGIPSSADGLQAHAERYRPWRSYAAVHLWSMLERRWP